MSRAILCLLALLLVTPAAAATAPGPPRLDAEESARIAEGKLVLKKIDEDGKARVTGYIEVAAPGSEIWKILLSGDHMVTSAGAVKEVTTYEDSTVDGKRTLRWRFLLRVGFSDIVYHVHRQYHAAQDYMTWELDLDKENDIKWTEGSYSLHPGSRPGRFLLQYEARIETGKHLPAWLEEELTESSLKRFLLYVKKTAEG